MAHTFDEQGYFFTTQERYDGRNILSEGKQTRAMLDGQ